MESGDGAGRQLPLEEQLMLQAYQRVASSVDLQWNVSGAARQNRGPPRSYDAPATSTSRLGPPHRAHSVHPALVQAAAELTSAAAAAAAATAAAAAASTAGRASVPAATSPRPCASQSAASQAALPEARAPQVPSFPCQLPGQQLSHFMLAPVGASAASQVMSHATSVPQLLGQPGFSSASAQAGAHPAQARHASYVLPGPAGLVPAAAASSHATSTSTSSWAVRLLGLNSGVLTDPLVSTSPCSTSAAAPAAAGPAGAVAAAYIAAAAAAATGAVGAQAHPGMVRQQSPDIASSMSGLGAPYSRCVGAGMMSALVGYKCRVKANRRLRRDTHACMGDWDAGACAKMGCKDGGAERSWMHAWTRPHACMAPEP